MKKFMTIALVLTMLLSLLAGCGSANKTETTPETTVPEITETETTPEITEPETTAPEAAAPGSALEILENIWNLYADEEKFSIMGGNMESAVFDAPGNYDLTYAENLTYNLLIPAEQIANVDQVASMIHAMNANTFTCGAFHLAEGVEAADFAAAMQAAVQGNMWMCGFPERLIITSVGGEYVIVAFGVNDAMTPFQTHLNEAYPEAELLFDEPIA